MVEESNLTNFGLTKQDTNYIEYAVWNETATESSRDVSFFLKFEIHFCGRNGLWAAEGDTTITSISQIFACYWYQCLSAYEY